MVMIGGVVDILPTNSVAKRPRLPFRIIDLIPIVLVAVLAWQLFVGPRLQHPAPVRPPDGSIVLLRGGKLNLQDEHGQVVFIDFFATWCEPCRQAFPVLEHYADTHPEIKLITIDVGEPPTVLPAFLAHRHLANNALIAIDPHAHLADHWSVQGFPTIIGIGPDGTVRDRWDGYEPLLPELMNRAEHRYLEERRDSKKAAMASRDS